MSVPMISVSLQMPASELATLLALASKSGVKVEHSSAPAAAATAKKAKKEKDPDAPKKEPNAWIKFCQHVRATLVEAGHKPGFEAQQFCSMIKAALPLLPANEKGKQEPDYSSVKDEDIVAGYAKWTPPAESKAAVARSKASSAAGSPADETPAAPAAPAAPAEKKLRKPQSEETKKAAAAKRAATKARKAAEAVAAAGTEAAAPKPKAAKAPAVAVASEDEEDEEDEEGSDISNFAPVIIKGKPYVRNFRGDVLTEEYDWVGRWNEATKTIDTKFPKPADLDE
jgi:hypothetical protein